MLTSTPSTPTTYPSGSTGSGTLRRPRLLAPLLILLFGSTTAFKEPTRSEEEALALELVTAQPTARAHNGWNQEMLITQTVLDHMREVVAERKDQQLLAVAVMARGIHPYDVLSFVRVGSKIRIVETSLSWGEVLEKHSATVSAADLKQVISMASEGFDCTDEPVNSFLHGNAVVHWPRPGIQSTCSRHYFVPEGVEVASFFVPLENRQLTFKHRRRR